MEPWVFFATVGSFLEVIWTSSGFWLLKNLEPSSYNAVQFSIAFLLIFLYNLFFRQDFKPNYPMLIGGLLCGIQLFFLNKGFAEMNNPGLGVALFRTEIIFTTIVAYFLFKSPMTIEMIVYMLIIVVGMYLLSMKDSGSGETFEFGEWQLYTLIALGCVVITDGLMKFIMTSNKNISMVNIATNFLFTAAGAATILQFIDVKKLGLVVKKDSEEKDPDKDPLTYVLLLVCGFIEMIYIIIMAYTIKFSFNPGMGKAIISSSAFFITLLSTFIFKDATLDAYNWGGLVLILIFVTFIGLMNKKGQLFIK